MASSAPAQHALNCTCALLLMEKRNLADGYWHPLAKNVESAVELEPIYIYLLAVVLVSATL